MLADFVRSSPRPKVCRLIRVRMKSPAPISSSNDSATLRGHQELAQLPSVLLSERVFSFVLRRDRPVLIEAQARGRTGVP